MKLRVGRCMELASVHVYRVIGSALPVPSLPGRCQWDDGDGGQKENREDGTATAS